MFSSTFALIPFEEWIMLGSNAHGWIAMHLSGGKDCTLLVHLVNTCAREIPSIDVPGFYISSWKVIFVFVRVWQNFDCLVGTLPG